MVWACPLPPPTQPRRLLCSPLCQIQPCCTPGPSSGTPGSLLFGLALCCSPAWSLSLPARLTAVAFPPSHLTACFQHRGGLCSRDIVRALAYTPVPRESSPLGRGFSLQSLHWSSLPGRVLHGAVSCRSLHTQSRGGARKARGAHAGQAAGQVLTAALGGAHPVPGAAPSALVSGVAFHPYITPWSLLHVSSSCGTGTLNHLPSAASSRGRVKIHARPVCALSLRALPSVLGHAGWGSAATQDPQGQSAAEQSSTPWLPAPEPVLHLASCCLGGPGTSQMCLPWHQRPNEE